MAGLLRVRLHKLSEAFDRLVPLVGDETQELPGLDQTLWSDLPDLFSTVTAAPDQARIRERVQVFRDGLPRHFGAVREAGDGERAARTEARHQSQSRVVSQCSEHGRSLTGGETIRARALNRDPSHQALAMSVTYFSMSLDCAAHPPSLAAKALARRSSGIRSKPDSVIVSLVPPSTSSR